MNLIDSICLIILIYGSYKGFKNGIVGELLSFLGILLGIYLSKTYYPIVDEYLATIFDSTNQGKYLFDEFFVGVIQKIGPWN